MAARRYRAGRISRRVMEESTFPREQALGLTDGNPAADTPHPCAAAPSINCCASSIPEVGFAPPPGQVEAPHK